MRLKKYRGAILALTCALAGCGLISPSSQVLYQENRTVIQLEKDPSDARNSHPASIPASQLAKVLDGVLIQQDRGLGMAVFKGAGRFESAFNSEEIALLSPLLSKALLQADSSQRVGFTFWSPVKGRGYAPFSGTVAVRAQYLVFSLKEHPASDWQDRASTPAQPAQFALDFKEAGVLNPAGEDERKGSYRMRPTLQIDYKRYLAALDGQGGSMPAVAPAPANALTPAAPAVPPPADVRPLPTAKPVEPVKAEADPVKDLQRQVKELTDSNQDLRARLKEALDRQDQSRAAGEELTRLRQELAETKQLLGEKVLELNRLKNKSERGKR